MVTHVRSNSLRVELIFNASPMASAPSLPNPFHARFKVFRVIFSYTNNIYVGGNLQSDHLAFLFHLLQDGLKGKKRSAHSLQLCFLLQCVKLVYKGHCYTETFLDPTCRFLKKL